MPAREPDGAEGDPWLNEQGRREAQRLGLSPSGYVEREVEAARS